MQVINRIVVALFLFLGLALGPALVLSSALVAGPALAQDEGLGFGPMDLGEDDTEDDAGELELAPIPAEPETELELAPIPGEPETELELAPIPAEGEPEAEPDPDAPPLAEPRPPRAPAPGRSLGGPYVGVKVGVGLGQPFGPFGAAFTPELEVGYGLDFGLAFFLAGQYAAPVTEGTVPADPRLPGDGVMGYTLTQNELVLTLGALYRIPVGGPALRPYASLGPRLYLMRTDIEAAGGGEDFGANEETATEVGLHFALGAELVLGPGALVGEVQLGYAPIDGLVLRDTSAGALGVNVGYRLLF